MLYPSSFVEVNFWTEYWVSMAKGCRCHNWGSIWALWVLHVGTRFVPGIFGYFKKLEIMIFEAVHHPGLCCPCWLFCKKWHTIHNENIGCKPFQVMIPCCTSISKACNVFLEVSVYSFSDFYLAEIPLAIR